MKISLLARLTPISGLMKLNWVAMGEFPESSLIPQGPKSNFILCSNDQFDLTTADAENSWIENGQLHIRPTLQDKNLINTNSVINFTADGTCTSDLVWNCVAVTNTTNGTIVPPIKSARLNTKKGATIKYGKVEVTAKISKGDW